MNKSMGLGTLSVILLAAAALPATAQPPIEFDHIWIMVSPNAPERTALERSGFRISRDTNHHDGQGTASITAEFENAFLELMWPDSTVSITPGMELGAEKFRQRMLWRSSGWCPIGVGFHRTSSSDDVLPLPIWSIRAPWLPPGSAIEMLTPRDDKSSPSLFISPRALTDADEQAARGALYQHPIGVHRVTSIRLILPETYQPIGALAYLTKLGVLGIDRGNAWTAELTFDGGKKKKLKDLRPDLPLVIRY